MSQDLTPSKINQEFFDSAKDNDLLSGLYFYVCNLLDPLWKLPYTNQDCRELLMTLPIGLRSLYLISVLRWEVENGGFAQFISNRNSFFNGETEEALEVIGSIAFLTIFRRFRHLYDQILSEHPILQRYVLDGQLTPEESALIRRCWDDIELRHSAEEEKLTGDFYLVNEDIGKLQLTHARTYPSLYYHP